MEKSLYYFKDLVRFWSKVDIRSEDECWNWTGCDNGTGYGQTSLYNKGWLAHRLAFYLYNNIHPKNLFVCHSCDNRKCCNPKHLWLGTHLDNMKDARQKGRMDTPGAKLNREQVREIKQLIKEGKSNTIIGKIYNVTHSNISCIKRNLSWLDV